MFHWIIWEAKWDIIDTITQTLHKWVHVPGELVLVLASECWTSPKYPTEGLGRLMFAMLVRESHFPSFRSPLECFQTHLQFSPLLRHFSWNLLSFSLNWKKKQFSSYCHKTSDSFCKTKLSPQNSSVCAQNGTNWIKVRRVIKPVLYNAFAIF